MRTQINLLQMQAEILKYYARQIKNYRIARPLVGFGKRYIYNQYFISKLRRTEFPPEIWMENTNLCNAESVMCPCEKQIRSLGLMKISLFEKLIKEI